MGCGASKRGCCGENRSEELVKCAAFSSEVRWSWLRGRTFFSFSELRTLLKVFQASTESELQQHPGSGSKFEESSALLLSGKHGTRAPFSSTAGIKPDFAGAPAMPTMDKAQFLSLCDSDETFRLSEVVGAFGSRLFDVLDEDGDGRLGFEAFALGLSKLLKGPESEKLKLMYAAYDLSGVVPSEERRKRSETGSSSSSSSCGGGGGSRNGNGGKIKPSRRSKYLTLENISAVLASASQVAYPTLLEFSTEGATNNVLSGSSGCGSPERRRSDGSGSEGEDGSPAADGRGGARGGEAKVPSRDGGEKAEGAGAARAGPNPEALASLLQELARRNAASYAARAVSEFGQVQDGALTQKEFEKWVLTGPVLRCRINEFSIDINVAPFQGVRLA